MWPPIFPRPMNPMLAAFDAAELDIFFINTALIVDLQVAAQIERCRIGIDTHLNAISNRFAWKMRGKSKK